MNNREFNGNTRFLYLEAPSLPLDVYSFHQRVLQDMQGIGNLTALNPLLWVYFFAPSSTPSFASYESWIGQEVIGPLNKEMLKDRQQGACKMIDFDSGPTSGLNIQLESVELFNWEMILQGEQNFRQNFKGELAETWRVALPWPHKKSSAYYEVKLQFFEKVR